MAHISGLVLTVILAHLCGMVLSTILAYIRSLVLNWSLDRGRLMALPFRMAHMPCPGSHWQDGSRYLNGSHLINGSRAAALVLPIFIGSRRASWYSHIQWFAPF